jgi:hypothetical protein
MIGMLDGFREHLEDLGGGLGLTDPVSGDVVVKLAAAKPAMKKMRAKKRPNAKSVVSAGFAQADCSCPRDVRLGLWRLAATQRRT